MDIIWRPGPEFSLSVPIVGNEDEVIVVRDFWMSIRIQGPPVPTWGSWMLDVDLPYSQPKHGNNPALSAGNFTRCNKPLLETLLMVLNT